MNHNRHLIKKGRMEAHLNFPNLKLNIQSEEPISSLRELTRILHTIKAIEFNREFYDYEEDPVLFRLGYLSEELRENEQAMNFLKSAVKVEDSFKHKKLSLENTKILDFNSKNYTTSVNLSKIKLKIISLCQGMDKSSFAIVHIMGSIPDDEKNAIVDVIKNRLSRTEIKHFFTNKEVLGKTVIESIFFGPFEDDIF